MCRWLAYSGTTMLLDTILYKPAHSLIDQSLHSKLGVETTNGDGFGVGWYAEDNPSPALLRDVGPAWNNRNLREMADHVRSHLFFAHIRASTGTAVQQSNCHPSGTAAGCSCTTAPSTVPPHAPGPHDARRPRAVRRHRRDHGLRDDVLPRPHLRPRPGPAHRHRPDGGGRGAGRTRPRGGVPPPDDGRRHRRRERVGLPLLQPARVPVPLLQQPGGRAAPAAPGCRLPPGGLRRDPPHRLRTPRGPAGGLARGTGEQLRPRAARSGRPVPLHPGAA